MANEVSEMKSDAEAVYYSALALLDELGSREARRLVVLNWVKYILLGEVAATVPVTEEDRDLARHTYALLCSLFAFKVLGLPRMFDEHIDMPCGECPACIAAGIQPPTSERPTEPAPKDETIN